MPPLDMIQAMPYRQMDSSVLLPKDPEPDDWQAKVWYRLRRCIFQHAIDVETKYKGVKKIQHWGVLEGSAVPISPEEVNEDQIVTFDEPYEDVEILNPTEVAPRTYAKLATLAVLNGWDAKEIENPFLEAKEITSLEEGFETIYRLWDTVNDRHPGEFRFPFEPIIEQWQLSMGAKHITPEHFRTRPVGLIDKGIMGSIREVVLDIDGTGELPVIHEETPTQEQLMFWEPESILPAILPWQRWWDGISLTTKSGAVSHGVCIAEDVFMELDSNQVKDVQKWELGTILRSLHPNLSDRQISRSRGKYLIHVIKGLQELQYLGWETRINGQSGLYLPIKIKQRFMPTINSPDDFPVIFEIAVPVGGTTGNMLVEKDVIRRTRKNSANQLNAAKTCYWLIDTHGTQKTRQGKAYIIDPTRPEEVRDADGYLIHPKTRVRLCNSKGRPIRDITDPEAVRQLPREENIPQRNRYEILLPCDRIRAVFPAGYPQRRATALARADKAFDALAQDGYFEVEKLDGGSDGWRIMPSKKHVARYRAVAKASKNAD